MGEMDKRVLRINLRFGIGQERMNDGIDGPTMGNWASCHIKEELSDLRNLRFRICENV